MSVGSRAHLVAVGILLSRVAGLVREKTIAWFFGVGALADVVRLAFRAPNVLQNLLGEQTLSASFIPIYSKFLAEDRRADAGRFAGAVFGLLAAVAGALALVGVLAAPLIVRLLSPGFVDDAAKVARGELAVDRLALTVDAVRIVFPMTAILVLSAWALGILNSHRRFFLSYLAPVFWNAAIIAAAVWIGWRLDLLAEPARGSLAAQQRLLLAICWGGVAGGLLQFLVQVPSVLRLSRDLRPSLSTQVTGVRQAISAFGPALAGRGVVQLSSYIDFFLASFLAAGAMSSLGYAFTLGNLPLSVFGMSVAAAELPELAGEMGGKVDDGVRQRLVDRIERAIRQAGFLIAPAIVGLFAFGFLVAGLLFQGGRYTRLDNWLVYATLCGYTVGLLASMLSRLLQNTYFAFGDTRTPAKIATVRIVGSAGLGALLMLWLDRYSVSRTVGVPVPPDGQELYFGAVGLSLAAGISAWVEVALLVRRLRPRLPELRIPVVNLLRRLGLALASALPAAALWWLLREQTVFLQALAVLPLYAAIYLGIAWWRRLPELGLWLGRLRR